eukprot:1328509-Rhodomonas_salina.1
MLRIKDPSKTLPVLAAICLRTRYEKPGTDVVYPATSLVYLYPASSLVYLSTHVLRQARY